MKSIASLVIATSMLVAPLYSFAQQTGAPLTRAEVRADLVQVEHAGYSPTTGEDSNYPADIEAAESKLNAGRATLTASSVGGATSHAESGHRSRRMDDMSCVGPISYCTLYFGS